MVEFGALLGYASAQGCGPHSCDSVDPPCNGRVPIGDCILSGIGRARSVVSGHNVDCVWNFQHSRILS